MDGIEEGRREDVEKGVHHPLVAESLRYRRRDDVVGLTS